MNTGINFLIALIAMGVAPTAAATATADAYARGFEIGLKEKAPIYQVTLTRDVYRSSASASLGDIAVFNDAGERVPHMLRAPVPVPVAATDSWVALPIFPVPTGTPVGKSNITVQTDGTLIRIEGEAAGKLAAESTAYIVDASGIRGRVAEIDLVLGEPVRDFVLPVAVDAGSSVSAWQPLVENYRLAALEYAGHKLTQTRIPISNGGARYLRVRPLQPNENFQLSAVRARVRHKRAHARTPLMRFKVSGTAVAERPNEIRFDLAGHFPIHEVSLNLLPNQLLQAKLESRSSPTGTWRRRHAGVFYALEREGLLLRPNAIKLSGVRDRYWRLSGIEPAPSTPFAVELVVAWKAQELVFLAGGEPPYLLAVGRAEAPPDDPNYAVSLRKIADPDVSGRAVLGAQVVLGGEAKMIAPQVIPWRQILLWAVLLAGVGTVGVMVMRLVRQMKP